MIRKGEFPEEFKTSRVIPLKKKGKDESELDSFRPVNNLNLIEKVLEQLVKEQLDVFLKNNQIIPEHHHGYWKGHFRVTAAQVVQHELHYNQDNKKHSAILLTDLGSAFDLCVRALLK